jgi:hypothetical protein
MGRIGDSKKEPENRRAGEPEKSKFSLLSSGSPIPPFSDSFSAVPRFYLWNADRFGLTIDPKERTDGSPLRI